MGSIQMETYSTSAGVIASEEKRGVSINGMLHWVAKPAHLYRKSFKSSGIVWQGQMCQKLQNFQCWNRNKGWQENGNR